MGGQPPGLVSWSWIWRARCGKGETADVVKWASELILPKLADRYPPDSEARASLSSGMYLLFHQAVTPGNLQISADSENGLGFSVILQPQEC